MNFKLLLINTLSVVCLVKGQVSQDCKTLGAFLEVKGNWDCCSKYDIKCDTNGNILEADLFYREYPVDSDFSDFPILSHLKSLTLQEFDIKTLPSRIFDLPSLETLNISDSPLSEITNDINLSSPLQNLSLSRAVITDFPSNFFQLPKLKKISLMNCIDLNAKLIHFSGSPLEECHFVNSDLSCYQSGTCKNLDTYQEDIPACTEKQINDILNSQSKKKVQFKVENKTETPASTTKQTSEPETKTDITEEVPESNNIGNNGTNSTQPSNNQPSNVNNGVSNNNTKVEDLDLDTSDASGLLVKSLTSLLLISLNYLLFTFLF